MKQGLIGNETGLHRRMPGGDLRPIKEISENFEKTVDEFFAFR